MPRGRKTVTPGHEKVTPRAQKGAPGGAGLIPSEDWKRCDGNPIALVT